MRTAKLCACIAFLGVTCFADDNPQDKPTTEQVNPANVAPAQSIKATAPAPGDKTDPTKLAAPPTDVSGASVSSDFVIGAEDVMSVNVWHNNDLSGTFLVQPDGFMAFPLIGRIKAAGLTPEGLGKELERRLSEGEFVRNPNVTVSVQQVNSRKYYVTGEMSKTGSFPLVMPTTILQALSNAGGFRDFANKKKVIILRTLPDGTHKELYFNYNEVIKNKNVKQNIYLEPDDHIIVK
jgi:polysaccharide export outer membrane protein